jgi:hypothetical protein
VLAKLTVTSIPPSPINPPDPNATHLSLEEELSLMRSGYEKRLGSTLINEESSELPPAGKAKSPPSLVCD